MSEFTLTAILRGDSLQLSEVIASVSAYEGLSPSRLRIQLARQLLRRFQQPAFWDAQLSARLQSLWELLIPAIARDDEFYCNTENSLRTLLQALLIGRYWYPREGKPAQQFLDNLVGLIDSASASLANPAATDTASIDKAVAGFQTWFAGEEKRAAMLETRLCETELANLKQISAETRVIDLLNKYLAHRPLPVDAHALIGGALKSELQYWAFTQGTEELTQLPLWKSWNRLLPALGELFGTDERPVDDQLLYRQIPLVLAELERSGEHTINDRTSYQQLLKSFNRLLMAAVQKQPLDIATFEPLPHSPGQSSSNTQVPASLLKQTAQIQVGDWFIFSGENNETLRCKLALKNPDIDQLLLVDHTGRKVMIKSHKDFALCLSTGIASALPALTLQQAIEDELPEWIERANKSVQAQLQVQKERAQAVVRAIIAQQQAAAEAAEKARAETEARMQHQLEARRSAARKALAEARSLADEQRRRAAEQAAEEERLRIEQAETLAAENLARQHAAQQAIRDLQVGAWLELTLGDKKQRAKLSVIIASTNKYIFADQVGRKVAEYRRDQLQELIAHDQVKVLRNGDNFEDQLAKVIRGLRRDMN